jgi:hypothetical protein
VALRQAIGYKFDTEAANLKRFDRFTLEKYPEATILTKAIVLDWCKKRDYETRANQLARTSVIRQLGKYLNSIEIHAYIIPKGYYPKETQYIPYIYSIEELQGKDLTAYLPVLRTYMGHDSFNETAYYLRLTVDVFPDVMQKVEIRYPGIIPTLEGGINESH